jgi:AraC family transcriptional regulator
MAGITNGNINRQLEVADLLLTETYHQPRLRLRTHDHERANINIVIDGYLEETVEGSSYSCERFGALLKPVGAKHSNHYGTRQTHCLIVEFMRPSIKHDTLRAALAEIRYSFSPESRNLSKQIWTEFRARDSAAALMIEGLVIQLLGTQIRFRRPSNRTPRWLEQCRQILDSTLLEPPSISEISRYLQIDRAHLTKQFAKHYGKSPGAYLRSLRVERAQDLLRSTDKSLCDVALETGFYDQSHFSRAFAAHTGCTPSEFRRIYRPQTSHNLASIQD